MNRGIWEELEHNRAVYRLLTAGAAREVAPAGPDGWELQLNPKAGDFVMPPYRPTPGDRREPLWGESGTGRAESPPEQAPEAERDRREEELPPREVVYSLGRVSATPASTLAAGAEDSPQRGGEAGPQPAGPKEDPVDALLERLEQESRLRPQVAEE